MKSKGSNTPKKILLLARGGILDGSQRQVVYLAAGMDRTRFEPVIVLDRPGLLEDHLRQIGVDVHVVSLRHWRSLPMGLLRYVDALRIARLGRRGGVCLAHSSDMARSFYLHSVAKRLGIPGVLHVRGPVSPRDIAKHRVENASAVIAIAQRYRQDLLASGIPPQRVEVIDDAVDLRQFRPGLAGPDDPKWPRRIDGGVLVGLVGRIEPFKRVLEFLEAIAPLARKPDHRATYLVIGRAKRQDYFQEVQEEARRLGLQHRVIFTGHCGDIARALSGLDILMTMSGGSVMFEAMACAKPVLSVRTDGRHSEHTRHGETAWCVTADRPEPATEALARLIEDRALRERLGQAARTRVERHLAPEAMAAKTQALYERLIGG